MQQGQLTDNFDFLSSVSTSAINSSFRVDPDSSHHSPAFDSLQLSPDQLEQLQKAVSGFVADFNVMQKSAPGLYPVLNDEGITDLLAPPPEVSPVKSPSDISRLLGTVQSACATGIETSAGKQLSYIPGSGQHTAALARYLGAVLNRFTGLWSQCPGAVALEKGVIDWMLSQFGLSSGGGGVLLSGASLSNFTAVVTARDQSGEDFHNATVYLSENTHHSVIKACRLAGIPKRNLRTISLNNQHSMHLGELERVMMEDRDQGCRPALLVATAGSTDTGAIDDLNQCSALAQEYGAWFHVDAAYGGFFVLTERGKHHLDGIQKADSIAVDAHKSLFMPFGIGALLVADRTKLCADQSEWGGYMRDMHKGEMLPDFCLLGPELTRPFRGLEMWLPLHLHGVNAFRRVLDRMLDLNIEAGRRLSEISGLEIVSVSDLSIVSFRCCGGDRATEALRKEINASGHAHVSSCRVHGMLALRLVFLNPNITQDLLTRVISIVEEYLSKAACEDSSRIRQLA